MSYSNGVFSINSAGQPVVTGTVLSSTAFNALTADLATGLSTAVLKDGTQTMTGNLPMSGFKLTGLGAGSTTGDSLRYEQLFTSGNVTLLGPLRGPATMLSPITNSLAGDVNLNNTANFFDGPSIAQGTAGSWFASGTVTIVAGVGNSAFYAKLWDGTTVISSTTVFVTATANGTISLSGFITSPVGNIRISVRDISATDGKIIFNATGTSADSTITAIRIA